MTASGESPLLEPAEFEARLRRIGEERYHDRHPFNLRMHDGALSREEIQTWVSNRYYYQTRIPIKDGMILSKATDPAFRREWVHRIHDHDGRKAGEGGLELWLSLAEAVGLSREEVKGQHGVLPGVRRACDAYVEFVDSHDLLEAVAASLTELFAGNIMSVRIAAFEKHYPWVDHQGLEYFQTRTFQAPRDAAEGLRYVLSQARTRSDQERCLSALESKCEILWSLLDAIELAFARPRLSPHAQLRRDDVDAPALVVVPERAVKLNVSGLEILELCDGAHDVREIAAEIRRRHPEASDPDGDVHRFLEEMGRLLVIEFTK
jgi:pyrroloquinoline-quinone synthase